MAKPHTSRQPAQAQAKPGNGNGRARSRYVVLHRLPDANGRRIWEERGTHEAIRDGDALEAADKADPIQAGEECRAVSERNWNPLFIEEEIRMVNGAEVSKTRKARPTRTTVGRGVRLDDGRTGTSFGPTTRPAADAPKSEDAPAAEAS